MFLKVCQTCFDCDCMLKIGMVMFLTRGDFRFIQLVGFEDYTANLLTPLKNIMNLSIDHNTIVIEGFIDHVYLI